MNVLKGKKGFTLVEVIVVLVILAILIALLAPTLTGYIDKAKTKGALVEGKQVLTAFQTLASENYAHEIADYGATSNTDHAAAWAKVLKLAELDQTDGATENPKNINNITKATVADGEVKSFTYTNPTYTVTYDPTKTATNSDGVFNVQVTSEIKSGTE